MSSWHDDEFHDAICQQQFRDALSEATISNRPLYNFRGLRRNSANDDLVQLAQGLGRERAAVLGASPTAFERLAAARAATHAALLAAQQQLALAQPPAQPSGFWAKMTSSIKNNPVKWGAGKTARRFTAPYVVQVPMVSRALPQLQLQLKST